MKCSQMSGPCLITLNLVLPPACSGGSTLTRTLQPGWGEAQRLRNCVWLVRLRFHRASTEAGWQVQGGRQWTEARPTCTHRGGQSMLGGWVLTHNPLTCNIPLAILIIPPSSPPPRTYVRSHSWQDSLA